MRKNQKGFSLIELLIVVAIILVLAAIAIRNLMSSRMSANGSSAVGSLRTITTAEINYAATYPDVGFTALASLGGAQPCTPNPAGVASSTISWLRMAPATARTATASRCKPPLFDGLWHAGSPADTQFDGHSRFLQRSDGRDLLQRRL